MTPPAERKDKHPTAPGGVWDAIVIGGGPAGLSAALMLGRARRRVLVLDAGKPRNRFAAHMHGVLGSEGSDPAELSSRGRGEAAEYGVQFADGEVESVAETRDGIRARLSGAADQIGRVAIVATGLTDELPDIPGLAERWGSTVLHCPYCHGWEVRDQRLGVLTTSPMSMHQALLVRHWSDRLTVFTAGLGPLDRQAEARLLAREIELVASPVIDVVDDGQGIAARTADGQQVRLDAIFTAGTPRPHDGFLAHLDLARTDTPSGSFLTVDVAGATSSDRIWAVGNVVNPAANVPVAIGMGALAGAAANGALVVEDFDLAESHGTTAP